MCVVAEAVTIVAVGRSDFQQGHSHETMNDYLARVRAAKRSPTTAVLRRQAHIAFVHIDIRIILTLQSYPDRWQGGSFVH